MRIIIDIDDVLFAWSKHAHEACLKAGVTNGAEITQWGFHKDYGITAAELWTVLLQAYRDGMLLHPAITGTPYQLQRLRDHGHTVHLVTARGFEYGDGPSQGMGSFVRQQTAIWLQKWAIPHDSLTFTKDKSIVRGDVGLDDNLANCEQMSSVGVVAWLMETAHNEGLVSKDYMIPRVPTLRRFVDLIVEIEQMDAYDVVAEWEHHGQSWLPEQAEPEHIVRGSE